VIAESPFPLAKVAEEDHGSRSPDITLIVGLKGLIGVVDLEGLIGVAALTGEVGLIGVVGD
jgi:hypothetical protein